MGTGPHETMAWTDAELLDAVRRTGDPEAMGRLYARHLRSAQASARLITGTSDIDDLVAHAFLNIFRATRAGKGPSHNVPGYLRAAIRNAHIDAHRRRSREVLVDDLDPGLATTDPQSSDQPLDADTLRAAMTSLPQRWQQVLRWTLLEDRSAAWVAAQLGLSRNAAAALTYRARQRLRHAYLTSERTVTA